MKKNLTSLTGIVFLIAILVAVGCKSNQQGTTADDDNGSTQDPKDPATEVIFVKEIEIDGSMHLFMFDSKKPEECGVIDDHLAVVKRGSTVKWQNAADSNIDEIVNILPVWDKTFFGAIPEAETRDLYKLEIPLTAPLDTIVKYLIEFTVKGYTDTFCIDPYLKIPDE